MIYLPLKELLDLSDSGVWGDEDTKGGISVLRSTNFRSNGTLDFTKLSFRAVEERKRSAKTLEVGDILLEKSGGGPQQPVGRVCLYRGHAISHSFGNFIARLRPKDLILSEFLFYFLWYFHATGKTSHYQKQTTGIRNLETQRFFTIGVPVPPLPEQRRIVDLLSRAEGIVRLRREAEKKAAELIPALFIDMFGDPAMNPKGWPVAKVGALLVEPPTLGTMAKPSNNIGQWLDLRVANIQGGQLTLVDKKWLDLPDSQVSRFALQSGDVVLARAIGSLDHLGKAVVLYPDAKWTFDSHLMRLRFDKAQLLPQVFKAFLESNSGRSVFLKHTRRSAVQFNINGKEIREISIPVPPMALQQSFWQRSQELQSIQSQQFTATAKAQATFDALLARFFAPTTALNSGSSD